LIAGWRAEWDFGSFFPRPSKSPKSPTTNSQASNPYKNQQL
jgi:hypothetical protein